MKFKRFSERDQAFLRKANEHGLEYALVIKADSKDYHHDVIGVACCTSHFDTEDGFYEIVYIPNLKGVNA